MSQNNELVIAIMPLVLSKSYLALRPAFAFATASVGSATSIFSAVSLQNMAAVSWIFWQQRRN